MVAGGRRRWAASCRSGARRLVGIDNSARTLTVAGDKFDALSIGNAVVVQGDLRRFALPDDYDDAAVVEPGPPPHPPPRRDGRRD
jgi:ubiquinone/menaquinone biosynthesis C-methylase UbiE